MLLVANAGSGSHEDEIVQRAAELLNADLESTETPEDLDRLLKSWLSQTEEESESETRSVRQSPSAARTVVVAGGDGSLHAVVNALDRLGALDKVVIGLVPLGTGNDFARGMGIPLDVEEAAALITETAASPVDLIRGSDGVLVVNAVHLGVGADASRRAKILKPILGRFGYLLGAVISGIRPKFLHLDVAVNGKLLSPPDRIAQVAIGNSSHVGGGTELVPGASPYDGQLTVIVNRSVGKLTRYKYLARLHAGRHYMMDEVQRVKGTEIAVAGQEFWVSADGEVAGPFTERSWEVIPGAVRFLTP